MNISHNEFEGRIQNFLRESQEHTQVELAKKYNVSVNAIATAQHELNLYYQKIRTTGTRTPSMIENDIKLNLFTKMSEFLERYPFI